MTSNFFKTKLVRVSKTAQRFVKDETGSTAIEYGLLASLIGIMMMSGASALGGNLNQRFTEIGTALSGPAEPPMLPASRPPSRGP